MPAIGWPPTKLSSSPNDFTSSSTAPLTLVTSVSGAVRRDVAHVLEHDRQGGHRHGQHDQRVGLRRPASRPSRCSSVASNPSAFAAVDALDRAVVAEDLAARLGRRAHHRAADQAETQHANGRFRHGFKGGT